MYYLRIVRLFWTSNGLHGQNQPTKKFESDSNGQILRQLGSNRSVALSCTSYLVDQSPSIFNYRFELTSACVIILVFAPLFLLKPFVL